MVVAASDLAAILTSPDVTQVLPEAVRSGIRGRRHDNLATDLTLVLAL